MPYVWFVEGSYPKSHKVNEGSQETESCNECHDGYVTKGIPIKLKSRRLWEEHRPNESAFSSVEASPQNHRKSNSLLVRTSLRSPCPDDLRPTEEKMLRYIGMYGACAKVHFF